jgi:hypothetical protein
VKSRKFLSILLVLVLVSMACSLGAPAQESGENNSAYPGSGSEYQPPAITYPAPESTEQPVVEAQQDTLYPDTRDGSEVPWNQALAMMQNDEVAKVTTGEGNQLSLQLKDGRTLVVLEPFEGALDEFLSQCGEVCATIEVE